jgi:hypothetical protein
MPNTASVPACAEMVTANAKSAQDAKMHLCALADHEVPY